MSLVIIDTDILIDAGREIEVAINCLKHLETQTQLGLSIVSEMELVVGCRNKTELRDLAKFLKRFRIIDVSGDISQTALSLLKKYRLSHGLLIPDGLIAATALSLDVPLITKNQRDYRFIDGLNLLPYPDFLGKSNA
jgi:hypothetical protein